MFNIGDLVFAKLPGRGPSWPATVTECLGNNQYNYKVKCFGTNTMADVKTSSLVTYSSYSLVRFDTAKNRKIKEFVLALEQIKEKRAECKCSSGCLIPTEQRQTVMLTIGDEGESEILDIGRIAAQDNKAKTPKKIDITPIKKRKAESVSDEKEVRIRGILTNRRASMIISPVPKRRRTVNFAQSPLKDSSFKDVTSTPLPLSGLFTEFCSLGLHSKHPQRASLFQPEEPDNLKGGKESENILEVASNIVEELNETRENIKKIMDMNQSKEQTIHYLSLLMNEKTLTGKEHDKVLNKNEMTTEEFCDTPDELNPQNDLVQREEHEKMVKKRISLISAKILEIDNDTLLDYSDINNCHQLELIKELESDETKTIGMMEIEKDSQNDNHPTTIINQKVLSEMLIKPELFMPSPDNISSCLDVNSNQDCVKPSEQDNPPLKPADQGNLPCKPAQQDHLPCKPAEQNHPPCKPAEQDHPPCKPAEQDHPPCITAEQDHLPCKTAEQDHLPCKQDLDTHDELANVDKSKPSTPNKHLSTIVPELAAKGVEKKKTYPIPKLEIEEDTNELDKRTADDSKKQDKCIVDGTEVEFIKTRFKGTKNKDKHTDLDTLPKLELKEDIKKLDELTADEIRLKPLDCSNSSDSSGADVSSDDFSDSEFS